MRKGALTICYLMGFSLLAYIIFRFHGYYGLPLAERPHSDFHLIAKPGGKVGHGLGVVGGAMILLLFLYSVRRRGVIRWGHLSSWLDVHIMFGILGPLFITLHTAMKFRGIVVVSYLSMVAVMLSGVFGRYLYLKIPRAMTGGELSAKEIDAREKEILSRLRDKFDLAAEDIRTLEGTISGRCARSDDAAVRVLLILLADDIVRPFRYRTLRQAVRRARTDLTFPEIEEITGEIKVLVRLRRNVRYLEVTQRFFHYWHVVHRPFAYVMVLIMLIHVTVVVYFGYRWIF